MSPRIYAQRYTNKNSHSEYANVNQILNNHGNKGGYGKNYRKNVVQDLQNSGNYNASGAKPWKVYRISS